MANCARKEGEEFDKYRTRRKKLQLDTTRALRARECPEGTYEGAAPLYIQAFDPKTGRILVPVFWVKAQKGVPFRRGEKHPNVMAV